MPLAWIKAVIALKLLKQGLVACIELFGFLEKSLGDNGEKFCRIGCSILVHNTFLPLKAAPFEVFEFLR